VTRQDDSVESGEVSFEAVTNERQSMYPDDGYILVKIDMLKPPGKALANSLSTMRLKKCRCPQRPTWQPMSCMTATATRTHTTTF